MLVFLDTEFTTLARPDPDLISIGMAAADGSDFYAERTDYSHDDYTNFVRDEVIPLLGKTPGAECTAFELDGRLRNSLMRFQNQQSSPTTIRQTGSFCMVP